MDRDAYLKQFSDGGDWGKRKDKALEFALDIRKFEIELYWKRATYFWTFISVAFGGFVAVSMNDSPQKTDMSVLIACVGCVFSFAWYCVNRGSRQWQVNWEKHVDLLEDEVIGPLYKTIAKEEHLQPRGLWRRICFELERVLVTEASISVAKVNQLTSVFVVLAWVGLLIYALPRFDFGAPVEWKYVVAIVISAGFCVLFWKMCKSKPHESRTKLTKRKVNVVED
jgi:hypothetical protein